MSPGLEVAEGAGAMVFSFGHRLSTGRRTVTNRSDARLPAQLRVYRKGAFTLIELMLVIAVIAIIAAIAIPSLLNARMSANEASAISTMRTLVTVNEQYRTRFGS